MPEASGHPEPQGLTWQGIQRTKTLPPFQFKSSMDSKDQLEIQPSL